MGARCGAVEELNKLCRLAAFRQHLEECFEYARPAKPPEPFPDAIPFAILAGKCAPCYAVYCEIVDSFKEFTIVMTWLSPA